MFKVTLVWWVAVISAGFTFNTTTTLAFVQNGRNYRLSEQTAVTEERKRRTKGFERPVVTSSFSPSSKSSLMLADTNQAEDADPDLFEYFDPLLSPHAYPSGISPKQKPSVKSNDEIQQELQRSSQQKQDSGSKGEFGFRLSNTEQNDEEKSQQKEDPGSKGKFGFRLSTAEQNDEEKFSSSTKGEVGFKIRPNPTTSSPTTEEKDDEKEVDLFEYFDPLRSPHEYPDGIKSSSSVTAPSALEVVDDDEESSRSSGATNSNSNGKKKKIGVLLMDHGSKKEKSNARLQAMAELYQMTLGTDEDEDDDATPTMIVRAAHMEIAAPSIPEQLKVLKDLGVDEIICHPFFLSADGRHVKEDIPEIIGNAIEDLWGENTGATPIPVVTTAPVGSNTQLMLGAIHSLVRENSQYLKTTLQNES
jgi:hypothetical protein